MVRIVKNFYSYIYMDATLVEALRILEELGEIKGLTEDLSDAIRVLKNFGTFYNMLRKRFKKYLAPRKSETDLISGRVVIDKLKLYRERGENRVTVVFDKRFDLSDLVSVLEKLSIKYEISQS